MSDVIDRIAPSQIAHMLLLIPGQCIERPGDIIFDKKISLKPLSESLATGPPKRRISATIPAYNKN